MAAINDAVDCDTATLEFIPPRPEGKLEPGTKGVATYL
jgi:hypothetical protein